MHEMRLTALRGKCITPQSASMLTEFYACDALPCLSTNVGYTCMGRRCSVQSLGRRQQPNVIIVNKLAHIVKPH